MKFTIFLRYEIKNSLGDYDILELLLKMALERVHMGLEKGAYFQYFNLHGLMGTWALMRYTK